MSEGGLICLWTGGLLLAFGMGWIAHKAFAIAKRIDEARNERETHG